MLPLLALLPAITSGISAVSGMIAGNKAQKANQQALAQQDKQFQAMRGLADQMVASVNPNAYLHQAEVAGQRMLGQLSGDFASRGVLQSGAFGRTSADTLSSLYADALSKAQSDRMGAYQSAIGAYGGLANAYGERVNPNPYGGMAAGLSSLGNSAAWYLDNRAKMAASQPAPVVPLGSGTAYSYAPYSTGNASSSGFGSGVTLSGIYGGRRY